MQSCVHAEMSLMILPAKLHLLFLIAILQGFFYKYKKYLYRLKKHISTSVVSLQLVKFSGCFCKVADICSQEYIKNILSNIMNANLEQKHPLIWFCSHTQVTGIWTWQYNLLFLHISFFSCPVLAWLGLSATSLDLRFIYSSYCNLHVPIHMFPPPKKKKKRKKMLQNVSSEMLV